MQPMFKVRVSLEAARYAGCNALDFCRSKGLPDTSPATVLYSDASTEVDEAFARAYFAPNANSDSESIDVDMLVPGELTPNSPGEFAGFVLSSDLPPDRIKALYFAGRDRRINGTR